MKSPYTGQEMTLKKEKRTFSFRKKEFEIIYHFYFCDESKEQFVDTPLATLNQNQIHNQYREILGIPFVDKIKSIRAKYQVSAKKLSEILGLGVNSYRLYENGEVPSVANGRLILSIDNPSVFIEQIKASSHLLSEKETQKLIIQAKSTLSLRKSDNVRDALLRPYRPSINSGYKTLDLQIVTQLIAFFQEEIELYKTKLNKLLFYADFAIFKETGFSLTGLQYRAITYGPVPKDYDQLYSFLESQHLISIHEVNFNGIYGDEIKINPPLSYSFDETTLQILINVRHQLKDLSAKEIVELSHKEKAWIENKNNKAIIPYLEGFWMVGLNKNY